LGQARAAVERLPAAERDRLGLDVALRQTFVLSLLGRQRDVLDLVRQHAGHRERVDDAALHIHTHSCVHARFRSKPISRAGQLSGVLSGYLGPLLLAWGEHDVTAEPPQASRALVQGRTDCRIRIVPGAGHWVQYEAAETVNSLLLEWLHGASQPLNKES